MEQIKLSTLFITHDMDEAILLSDRIYVLTGQPGQILHELVIDQPHPRTEAFAVTEQFLNYKKQILVYLKEGQ